VAILCDAETRRTRALGPRHLHHRPRAIARGAARPPYRTDGYACFGGPFEQRLERGVVCFPDRVISLIHVFWARGTIGEQVRSTEPN
jgi:hypothetical protein